MLKILSVSTLISSLILLTGCLTMSGDYQITIVDAAGKPMYEKSKFYAEGRMIYPVRNGLCANNPGATVHITDIHTGQELKSESPYKCR